MTNGDSVITIGYAYTWKDKFLKAFPAFKHRNYRLYFVGQFISMSGTWLQIVAQGWLVFQLTKSAYLVGVVAALALLPILLFSLFAGVIIDRYPKKPLIMLSQSIALICAASLGMLTLGGHITVWQIGVLAFLIGMTDAVDKPARQAFVIEMVGRKDLSSAIALNAGIFNSARVIGPAISGAIIALYGTGWAFLLNAVSYLFVIFSLYLIKVSEVSKPSTQHPLRSIKAGITYSFSLPHIKMLLILTTVSAVFGWSYATLLPVIISEVFHMEAAGLGYFYAASGIGALFATVLVSAYLKKINPLQFVISGNILFSIAIIFFTVTNVFPVALFFLLFAGLGLILQFATVNSMIQHSIANEFRGRVMSIYILMFMGTIPIGSYLMGILAELYNSQRAIQFSAIVVFAFSAYLIMHRQKLHAQYLEHADKQM